jgi:hypothetical protein
MNIGYFSSTVVPQNLMKVLPRLYVLKMIESKEKCNILLKVASITHCIKNFSRINNISVQIWSKASLLPKCAWCMYKLMWCSWVALIFLLHHFVEFPPWPAQSVIVHTPFFHLPLPIPTPTTSLIIADRKRIWPFMHDLVCENVTSYKTINSWIDNVWTG